MCKILCVVHVPCLHLYLLALLEEFILIYYSSILKQAIFAYVNHARIRSWNQPVLSDEGWVSCLRKQQEPLVGLKLTTDQLRATRATHCPTPPLDEHYLFCLFFMWVVLIYADDLAEFFKIIMAGLGGSPWMISSTLKALTTTMYQFKGKLSANDFSKVCDIVLVSMIAFHVG